jgi:hypothetical protein
MRMEELPWANIDTYGVRAGPDLGLCDLVRRPGAHIKKGPQFYIPFYIYFYKSQKNYKAQPSTYPVGLVANSTPRSPRNRS